MIKIELKKILMQLLKKLEGQITIPILRSALEPVKLGDLKDGLARQIHITFLLSGSSVSDEEISKAAKGFAYRINYANRFSRAGRLGIPKKNLAVHFHQLAIPPGTRVSLVRHNGIFMRIVEGYNIEWDSSVVRFDLTCHFSRLLGTKNAPPG